MTVVAHLLPLTVTWQQPGTAADRYGDDRDDWTDPAEEDIAAWIERRSATEVRGNRDAAVTQYLMITEELGVTARDRITAVRLTASPDAGAPDGLDGTFEVDGDPAIMFTPRGTHHLEAALQRVTG